MRTISQNKLTKITTTFYTQVLKIPATRAEEEEATPLSAGYVYGVSGIGFAYNIIPTTTGTLTEIWTCVRAISGTWASTDQQLNYEIRGPGLGNLNYTPSSALLASGTISVSAIGDGWWVVIYDNDGTATNYATLVRQLRWEGTGPEPSGPGYATTVGFSAAGTSLGYPPCGVYKYDNEFHGNFGRRWNITYVSANNSNKARGWKVTLPRVCSPVAIVGINYQFYNNFPNWKFGLWEGANKIPNDTPDWQGEFTIYTPGTQQIPACYFAASAYPVLLPGRTYYMGMIPSAITNNFGHYPLSSANYSADLYSYFRTFGLKGWTWSLVQGSTDGTVWEEIPMGYFGSIQLYAMPIPLNTIGV
jgi:hypothetical protein